MKNDGLTQKQKKIGGVCILVFCVLFFGVLTLLIGKPMIEFVEAPEQFRAWVDSHGIWSRIAFVGMVVLQVVVAAIPGEPFEIGAGYAFGYLEGTLLCMVGIVIGSAIIFGLVRRFGVKLVDLFFSRDKINSIKWLNDSKKLNAVVFLVSAIPGTPKDLLSYFIGLTKMDFKTWILIVSVSRIPSVVTSTVGGDAIGTENYVFAIIVFAVTLALAGVGLLIYNKINRQNSKNGDK